MKKRDWSFLLLGIALSLSVGLIRSSADAQTRAVSVTTQESSTIVTTPDGKIVSESKTPEIMLSGDDLAFKVDHSKDGRVMGTLMVRVEGQWKPVELSSVNALAR